MSRAETAPAKSEYPGVMEIEGGDRSADRGFKGIGDHRCSSSGWVTLRVSPAAPEGTPASELGAVGAGPPAQRAT